MIGVASRFLATTTDAAFLKFSFFLTHDNTTSAVARHMLIPEARHAFLLLRLSSRHAPADKPRDFSSGKHLLRNARQHIMPRKIVPFAIFDF